MSFATIFILVYLMVLKEGILTDTTDIWPSGEYGLPKAISGCPASFSGVSWEEGWIQQDLEDDDASYNKSNSSSSFHMDAIFTNEYLRRSFCMKIAYTNLKLWPKGTYCIYESNTCPTNMTTGYIKWDDEDNDNSNTNNGTLPSGNYDSDTLINYCCQDGGYWFNSIELPVNHPFYLLPHKSPHCQRVKWALSSLEYIVYDTENDNNGDKFSGSYVFAEEVESLPKFYYCYYEGCRHKLNGTSGLFASSKNVYDIYPNFQYCSWLITVNRTLLLSLNFTSIHVPNCQENYIEIYDGNNETFPLLARYCGSNATEGNKVESTGNNVYMVLKSGNNSLIPGMHPKFNVNYTTRRRTFSPRVISINGGGVHIVENNVVLNCIVEGDPVPSVTWKKVNIRNHSTSVYPRFVLENNNRTIVVKNTTTNDTGVYVCVAENRYGKDEKNTSITIAVPARVISITGGGVHIVENNVILNCIVEGDPVPSVTWKKVNIYNHSTSVYPRFVLENNNRTIVLKNTTTNDNGVYVCVAENSYGKDEKNTSITIAVPARVISVNGGGVHIVENNVILNCSVKGDPVPSVTWKKVNIHNHSTPVYPRFVLENNNRTIVLKNTTINDSGVYVCVAENRYGKDEKNTTITIAVPARVISINGGGVHIVENNVVLNCIVEGDPVPSVTWKKVNIHNHSKSVYPRFILANNNRTIVLKNTTINDTGVYVCVAENRYGKDEKNTSITIAVPARVISINGGGVHIVENNVILNCIVEGDPVLSVIWKKVNIHNHSTSVYPRFALENNNRTIVLKNTTTNDTGVYVCVAENRYGKDEKNTSITIAVPARVISINGGGVHIVENNVILNCSVEGHPVPSVTWKKVNIHNHSTPVYPSFVLQNNNRTIVLKNTTINDTGVYVCVAENRYGKDEKNTSIMIAVPARVISINGGGVHIVENNVTLNCIVGGHPVPAVTWKKVNIHNHSTSVYPRFVLENNNRTIVLKNTTINDAGVYVCVAENRYGKDEKNTSITIAVPARVISINGGGVHILENNVTLNCIVEGDPVPSVIWKKVNIHNHFSSDYHGFVLENNNRTIVLKNTTINDAGVYVCVAENRYGKDEKNTSITIAAFPDLTTTSLLEYVRVGQDFNITCSWQKEIDLLKIDNVEWIKNGRSINLSPSSRYTKIAFDELLVTNSTVKQSGRYQCKGNVGMLSKLSSFVDITVFVPSGPVVFESEPETTTTGIRLFWKPIEKSFWNGEEITYVISVMENHRQVKVYTTTDSEAIIAGLQPNTTYTIVLYGQTTLGETPRTAKITTTKPNKNNRQYELDVKLTDVDFSKSLEDHFSGPYRELKTSLEKSIDNIYEESSIRVQFIESRITGFRKGSVIAEVAISLDATFSQNPLIVVERLNDARTIAGHKFDKSFTKVKDFDECKDESFNSCHEYANCTNIDGSYICKCFEGFFGDGEKCQGPAQIIAKSASNVTQFVETNVTLVCTVIGDPNPVITWLRRSENGDVHQIKSTTNKYNSNLTIVLAAIEDSGVYICNASNILGHQSYKTRLTIKPVVVDIDVEIKLSHTKFEEELKNHSSSKYKKLEENVYVELFNFFNNTPGFDDIEILGFANGSIKVIFRIILTVKKPSTDTRDVVIIRIGKKLNNQLKKGRIGNIRVVPELLQIKERPPPPVNVTYADVKETEMHIYWVPPELYELFSIETYYVRYRKYGEFWINDNKSADLPTNALLQNLESNSFYSVQIIAENAYGVSEKSRTIEVKTMEKKVISPWYYIIPIICVLVIALIGLVFFLYRRFGSSRNWNVVETKKNKQHRKESGPSFQLVIMDEQSDSVHENEGFTQTDAKKGWDEIPRTSIALTEKILVPGQFGVIVVEGKVMRPLLDTLEPCSVKLFKDYTTGQSTHDLMEEIHNISGVGFHKNIVNLIGACTDLDGSPLLVLELCYNGTLENYLKINRKIDDEKRVVSKTIKMEWTNQIAKGMNHLAAVKIVHRDLATRNVFLTEDLTAKISNFGLSRNISEQGSYEKLSGGKLPARWMALESLTDGSYSMKSDVWSFGILLWEIETGASMPYQEFKITELVEPLRHGYRLPKPDKCPDKIYDLMLQCWKINPLDRPNFNKIADIVERNLADENMFINVPLGS